MERISFIKKYIAIFIIAIILIVVASIIIKYYVEGEKNMPFEISKIMIISNAGGIQNDQSENKWDLNLVQNNDIYIDIIKNKNYKQEEIIDKIIIDNFQIENEPQKGTIKIYRPNSTSINFENREEYKIENKLEYIGDEASDLNNLKIANQGGLILLRYVNEELGNYTSNEDEEIKHDGTLLRKTGITNDEIKFTISFDISIELKSEKKYKANVTVEMPKGNLIQEGTTNYQINGSDIVFKRY